jgi:hypothetical protein
MVREKTVASGSVGGQAGRDLLVGERSRHEEMYNYWPGRMPMAMWWPWLREEDEGFV